MTGDRTAQRAVLVALYLPTRRFASVVGLPDVDPDDLVQEAFVRLLQRGLVGIADPGAYLRRTVLNLARNERRREASSRRLRSRVGVPDAQRDAYPSDIADLQTLSAVARALLYLTEIEGAPIDEAARQVGISHTAARMRLSRARRQLRATIEGAIDEQLA